MLQQCCLVYLENDAVNYFWRSPPTTKGVLLLTNLKPLILATILLIISSPLFGQGMDFSSGEGFEFGEKRVEKKTVRGIEKRREE